jgi:hypothetical protein
MYESWIAQGYLVVYSKIHDQLIYVIQAILFLYNLEKESLFFISSPNFRFEVGFA